MTDVCLDAAQHERPRDGLMRKHSLLNGAHFDGVAQCRTCAMRLREVQLRWQGAGFNEGSYEQRLLCLPTRCRQTR